MRSSTAGLLWAAGVLALVGGGRTQLDAGSVALALARRWAAAGDRVLFIDGDTTGSRLAERLGSADGAEYSPAVRGLPTLIVAREQLTLRLLADHCYSLGGPDGSLWALFAPSSPAGGTFAARWLADHSDDIKAIDRDRGVIVSSHLDADQEHLAPLLKEAQVVAVLASIRSIEDAKHLRVLSEQAGLMGFERTHRILILDGTCPLSEDEVHIASGFRVAGKLPPLEDEKVLRLQGGRRERAFAGVLDEIAEPISALLALYAAGHGTADADESLLDRPLSPATGSLGDLSVDAEPVGTGDPAASGEFAADEPGSGSDLVVGRSPEFSRQGSA